MTSRVRAFPLALIVGVLAGAVLYLAIVEVGDKRTDNQLRAAAYRLCSRDNVQRAQAHSEVDEKARAVLERRIPILWCQPNLTGRAAYPRDVGDQRLFVNRYLRDSLTLAEQGLCRDGPQPDSAPNVC